MNLSVIPGKPLRGEVGLGCNLELPGDKSISHRAALLAALAQGESRFQNFLVSGVTQALLDCLTRLGVQWELQGKDLWVQGKGLIGELWREGLPEPVPLLNCGNSATTLRLLAGALAALGLPAVLDGSAGLRRRPMERIVAPLRCMGVDIQATNSGAPLTLGRAGLPLQPIEHRLPVASAQVKSCLLLAGLRAAGPSTLIEPAVSRDHTERMLRQMGVEVSSQAVGEVFTHLRPPQPPDLQRLEFQIPGDISAAAFIIVTALIIPGSQVALRGVGLNPTRLGLLDALRAMGADLEILPYRQGGFEPLGDVVVRASNLKGIEVSGELVVRCIDELPALAIAAACAQGETRVREAQELRHKESDRITALAQGLRTLGVEVMEVADGFTVTGRSKISAGEVLSHGDHRLAMAFTVAGLAAKGKVCVHDAQVISESFPDFVKVITGLGAQARWVE